MFFLHSRNSSEFSRIDKLLSQHTPHPQWMGRLAAAIGTIALAITLFALGFAVCCLPISTTTFARMHITGDLSPYAPNSLVHIAEATRTYTLALPGASGESAQAAQAENELAQVQDAELTLLRQTNHRIDTTVARFESSESFAPSSSKNIGDISWYDDLSNSALKMRALGDIDERLALSSDALSHLADCNRVITHALPWLIACCIVSCISIVFLKQSPRLLALMLISGPALLLGLLVLAGAAAVIDFDSFFGAFHGVFFPQGNWTFAADSLLIQALPEGFWMAMGATWLLTCVVASIISIIAGKQLVSHTGSRAIS